MPLHPVLSRMSDSEITLARVELLLVDLAAGVPLAQDLQRLVAPARMPLPGEPSQAEDEPEPKMGFRDKAKVLYDHAGRSGDDEG